MKTLTWHGCYDLSWKGFITPASFGHPAKMSRGLLERIIAHGFEKGYWQEGSTIGDCFGGVGTTGIIGAYHGLRVVSVELEPRFVSMARRNYALHSSKWKALGSPRPVILQGDSRSFRVLVGKADSVISSPPFNQTPGGAKGINVNGYNGRSDIKPDYLGSRTYQGQGGDRSAGNIEILKEGSVDSVVASPPYADTTRGNDACGIDWDKAAPTKKTSGRHQAPGASASTECGQSAGQIGALKSGSVDGVVASPPYVDGLGHGGKSPACEKLAAEKRHPYHVNGAYGEYPGQIERLASGEVSAVVVKDLTTLNNKVTTSKCLHIGARNSAGLIGNKPETRRSSATDTRALTAESEKISMSTTKKTRNKPAANGTTRFRISLPYASDITQCATPNPDLPETTCASSVGAHSSLAGEKLSNAERMTAAAGTSERLKKLTGSGKMVKGSASSAETLAVGCKPSTAPSANETYWQAVKLVYESCFRAIRPNGMLVLVCKDFVKAGNRVPLCDDTVRLIEHIGFQMVERVHAMLVKETHHADLFNGSTTTKTERKSFFRRLAEKRGSPKIDYECVIFARKPMLI